MKDDPRAYRQDMAALCQGWESVGIDVAALSKAGGLSKPLTECDISEVPDGTLPTMWRTVIEWDGRESVPVLVGAGVPYGAYDVIDYLAGSCETVGRGLMELARFFNLISTNMRWRVHSSMEPPQVSITSVQKTPLTGVYHQYALAITIQRFRDATAQDWSLGGLELCAPRPADTSIHEAFFRCPITYDAPATRFWMTRESWDMPMETREPRLKLLLERYAQDLVEQRGLNDPLREIRLGIQNALREGDPRIGRVARRLGTSSRTLQRRLKQAETTFQDLVDDERQAAACTLLREQRLSIAEVAYLLGYSDPSAFLRAFKRWTGVTPSVYQRGAA